MTALPELTPLAVAAAIDDFAASPQRGLAAFERLRSAAQPIHGEVFTRKRGRRGGWHAGRDDKENADALVTRFWVAAVYHGLHAHVEQSIEEFVGAAAGPLLAPRIRGVARVSETWGADFWAVLRRQGIHLQSDPSNSLVDQLAATARYYDDIEVFAADFKPFYASHHTRGRPASVNVVTATIVKNFLTWSLDMSLKPMPTLHLSRAVSPTTPVASLQKPLPSQPPEEREETGHGTAEIRPRKLAKTPSAATSPRPQAADEQDRRDQVPKVTFLPAMESQPPEENEDEQMEEPGLDDGVTRLFSPSPSQSGANIQQLTVAPSQSGANIQQLTVAPSQSGANIQQLTVAPSQSGANIQQLTVAPLQSGANIQQLTVAPSQSGANIQQLTVAPSQSGANIQQLTVAPSQSGANIQQLTVAPSQSGANIQQLTVAPSQSGANIQQLTVASSQSRANIQQLTVASLQRISINSLLADEDDLQSQPAYGTLSKSTRAVELPCGLSEYVKACQTAKVSTKARFDDLHLKLGLVPPPTPSLSVLQKEIAKLETRIQRQKDKIVAITDDLPDQETSFSLPDQATIFLTAIHDELARLKRVVTEDTERRDQLQEVARQIGPP